MVKTQHRWMSKILSQKRGIEVYVKYPDEQLQTEAERTRLQTDFAELWYKY
ncbi:hypothetical protein DPMN_154577 [Dreissena polymorpha]|uniref:Uncharacterized protein n=1 Tax=Dreissena polymorpha TaxID=45954 RepID=A0A9D4FKR3_DREPO|nr:hypothetical protein DPMN_154577 [Dreissena polymorpha]